MPSPKDLFADRYKATETETDKLGRKITVRRLRPAEQLAVTLMADTARSATETSMLIAASVWKIDDQEIGRTRNLYELGEILNLLDEEGLEAATKAYFRLAGVVVKEEEPAETSEAPLPDHVPVS